MARGGIRLVEPDPSRFDAWADCLRDFAAGPIDGSGWDAGAAPEPTPDAFADYLAARERAGDTGVAPAPGRVHCSYRWIVDDTWDDGTSDAGGPLLGFLACRHALNQFLFDQAGHIGYSVRPSARRQGVATAALRAGCELAAALGIDPVLVTCADTNVASRRVIETCGGVPDGEVEHHLRFWIGGGVRPEGPNA